MRNGILKFTYLGEKHEKIIPLLEGNINIVYYQEMAHEWLKNVMQTELKSVKKEGEYPHDISLKIDGEEVFKIKSFA